MKNLYYYLFLFVLLISFLFLPYPVRSNWINSTLNTPGTPHTPHTQNDSLPGGVTEDWLNDLRDENGNRIWKDSDASRSIEVPEDPEGDALQRKIFTGGGSNYYFGYSVSTAGDVNGDGFDDIIVGAYGFHSNTGRAYLYYGGLIMNTIADKVFTGEDPNDRFGFSLSSAGDVNGDGYGDIIVGAYAFSLSKGRAYVYYGGANMNNIADIVMTGVATGDRLGVSVSSAGDVNGDGYSDVIVGADRYSSMRGAAYIYFGGISMNNTADVILSGEATNNLFGFSVSSAGDLNGDGYSDVIVGAYGFSSNTGRAYVYFGGAAMNNSADLTMTGETIGCYYGFSVSSAGDVNGDGYSDAIVGASGYSSNAGRAYIYFGGLSVNNTADHTMTGEAANNYFGGSVSSAGDVNGDGYSDVIVGADGFISNTGKVYIYFGSLTINNYADVNITGETTESYFGRSVSIAGDVNGDGYSDLIVGAFGYLTGTGRVYLYDYFMKNEIIPDITMDGVNEDDQFGRSVSTAGDVNGDGYSDVIVGANRYSSYTGRAYIYYGGSQMNNNADVTLTGDGMEFFGQSVSSAGDVNGDGYSDVIVGASGYSTYTGRTYLYFGGASMNNTADVIMTGEGIYNNFGGSVSLAGDVNGDGYSDIIVGAREYSLYTGRAYVYFGGAIMNNTADMIMTGDTTYNYFGNSVSTAGDVNGDGYSDVIVGAYGYSTTIGRAYIFYGGASMNNSPDVIMEGEGPSSLFGFSVSTACDINGDGFSDVIVGAERYSSFTGKAYLYYGGAIMNNLPDVSMSGETPGDNFGFSVSSAGDINRDGYSDVIVGANGNSLSTGRAYVFFGGVSMNNIPDVTMSGETPGDNFGVSLSSAGDVNGDGYSDVIIGADEYSLNTGIAYTYFGSEISAKPILNYVKDVPNDQGGYVNLKWARSSYDVINNDLITDYIVYRSYPPGSGQFSWEIRTVIPATKRSFYTFTDNTPSDSSAGGNGTMFYQIMARTSSPSQYWLSGILSGRSIDNIAPPMVSPFTAEVSESNVLLNWGINSAPDLLNFVLFRSYSDTIDPYSETPLSISTSLTYLDTSPLSGLYYYFIVAQDIHGNYSPLAVTESPNITLNLTMFIEGFYNAGSNTQVSDTINVYLRRTVAPFVIADESTDVISSTGRAVLKFGNIPSGSYYIVVKHRNSIETWSERGITLSSGSSATYNFSTAATQAYGNNMKQVDTSPLRYGIYSGDENQNGVVDLTDVVNVSNAASLFTSGYVPSDMNGDNVVDLTDLVITSNNASAFVSVVTP